MITAKKIKTALLVSGISVVVLLGAYLLIIRPWHLTWGATEEEVLRDMAGDDIVPSPSFNGTRVVTINARPEEVWPWLVQMGYKKAGFYSYDGLDNDGIPSAEHIIPDYQDLNVGDKIPVSKDAYVTVVGLEPNRSMLWKFETGAWGNATWAWGLYEKDAEQTRLVTRLRIQYAWNSSSIVSMLMVDVVELVMMRKCMLGIKRRVESSVAQPSGRSG